MAPHWKFGQGFAIRYGGYRNIQWFKGEDYSQLVAGLTPNTAGTLPVFAVAELVQGVGLYLQWWETRKSNLLQQAQFEERRLGWLADILSVWYSEIESGDLRLDTVYYLDREISRFLKSTQKNTSIDAPSSLLLQVERGANLLVTLNQGLNQLLSEQSPNFTLPNSDVPQLFDYKPYYALERDPQQFGNYINTANSIISHDSTGKLSLGIGLGTLAANLASDNVAVSIAIGAALWTLPKLLEWRERLNRGEDRLLDFVPLQNFSVELRSTNALPRLMRNLPPQTKIYNLGDIQSGGNGHFLPNPGATQENTLPTASATETSPND